MKNDLQLQVINIIRELRQANELSQAGLSDVLNISYGLIGNIESTKFDQKYTLKQLQQACNHFNYPFTKLFLTEKELSKTNDEIIELLINKIIEYNG
jgi:putative transcriptional regulator